MSYTKGPWKYNAGFRSNDGSFAVTQDQEYDPTHIGFVTFHGKAKRGQAWCTPDPEGDANARLVAAAPEMYEALNVALAVIRSPQSFVVEGVCADIERVIRKATGAEKGGK